ncbi:MAG: DUF167 domain-containing protein [Candidatus Omnitrophica bacterium]|nr:DUF167 domain-containing protein [Candidatus Omnitrophota bacterium]
MKISVTVKPKSKRPEVKKIDPAHFVVAVKEPPQNGRANEAAIKMLAEFLDIAPSELRISSGHSSRRKIIEIDSRRRGNV